MRAILGTDGDSLDQRVDQKTEGLNGLGLRQSKYGEGGVRGGGGSAGAPPHPACRVYRAKRGSGHARPSRMPLYSGA